MSIHLVSLPSLIMALQTSVKVTELPPVTITDKAKSLLDQIFDWGPWVFNFGLLIVGGLQVWMLAVTWKTIKRQADLMESQEGHIERQTVILEDSVAAAKRSADAAFDQIQLIKNKERARLYIDFEPPNVMSQYQAPVGHTIKYVIVVNGTSQASITDARCVAVIHPIDGSENMESTKQYLQAMSIPSIIKSDTDPARGFATLIAEDGHIPTIPDDEALRSLWQHNSRIHCEGFIDYSDVFGDCWRVNFHRAWEFSNPQNPITGLEGYWIYFNGGLENHEIHMS